MLAVFYGMYSLVRNLFGSGSVEPAVALANAERIIAVEEALGLSIELGVQQQFLGWRAFIQFWNLYYGLFHFLVTYAVLGWLFVRHQQQYRFWRNAGLIATGLAIVGYATFPLMPPRLLADCGEFGGCVTAVAGEDVYVDTAADYGGLWSFESKGMAAVSNQYAAMPSLHIGWAVWSSLALLAVVRQRGARLLAAMHPLLTLFAIVVTANHYWIDGIGGLIVVAVGVVFARLIERRRPTAAWNA